MRIARFNRRRSAEKRSPAENKSLKKAAKNDAKRCHSDCERAIASRIILYGLPTSCTSSSSSTAYLSLRRGARVCTELLRDIIVS